jgi:hypothetical protein
MLYLILFVNIHINRYLGILSSVIKLIKLGQATSVLISTISERKKEFIDYFSLKKHPKFSRFNRGASHQ